jgi:hypothetical protein
MPMLDDVDHELRRLMQFDIYWRQKTNISGALKRAIAMKFHFAVLRIWFCVDPRSRASLVGTIVIFARVSGND